MKVKANVAVPQPEGRDHCRNLPPALVNFVSMADAMNNYPLVLRFGFVDDPPVARAQLEESFPLSTERQGRDLLEVLHKPCEPFDNSPLDRAIKLCQVLLGLWGNQKPPASHPKLRVDIS